MKKVQLYPHIARIYLVISMLTPPPIVHSVETDLALAARRAKAVKGVVVEVPVVVDAR